MERDDILQLVILVILLLASAFFSASETALMTLGKLRIRHMIDSGRKGAKTVSKLVESPAKLLGAILVGNNAVNIAASAIATSLCMEYFGASGVGISTLLMTLIVLVFGEITPKTLAAQHSEGIAVFVAPPMRALTTLLTPAVAVLSFVTGAFVRLLGGKPDEGNAIITEEELKTIVTVSHEEGVLESEEKRMIHNVIDFGDSIIKSVMTPRMDMVAVDIAATRGEVAETFRKERFSRLPVYEGNSDTVVGVLHFRDFVYDATEPFNLRTLMRKPFVSYTHKKAPILFKEMKAAKESLAVVVDEYGGTAGIVTLEDLVEEIVGEIMDEYDEDRETVRKVGEGEYLVEGDVRIEEFNRLTGLDVSAEHSTTIAGFISETLGKVPEVGLAAETDGARFTVESMSAHRIRKVRVLVVPPDGE